MSYEHGKIYALRSPNTELFYIGSTIQPIHKRLIGHKTQSKNNYHSSASIIINYGNPYIELMELYPCKCKDELTLREGELIRLHKDKIVNKKVEGRDDDEKKKVARECVKRYSSKIREKFFFWNIFFNTTKYNYFYFLQVIPFDNKTCCGDCLQ